jgi:2',3'-cyclic-nucleotide 2'-phosphodiesterase (5'-nucleotidase family)
MVWALVLTLVFSAAAHGWEITVAFTNDLHAYSAQLAALGPILAKADLVLDAGDTWEDTHRGTGQAEAWATMRTMAEWGYDAMVLGNHETYLGPRLLADLVTAAPFPVLATNLRSDLPTARWSLVVIRGVRVLILGLLWDLVLIWPGWELLDPGESARQILAEAPEHDLLILLGHMDFARAKAVAASLPECDLFVLGHNHRFLADPVWVGTVPIVQAGHHGQAVGLVRLTPGGLMSYELIRQPAPAARPSLWLPVAVALLLLVLWPRG